VPAAPRPLANNELVFGLVYGAGTETDTFQRLLRESLRVYDYELRTVHLSTYFSHILGEGEFQREAPDATRQLQDMGDELRKKTGLNDIAAQLAVFLIAGQRANADNQNGRVAWLVRRATFSLADFFVDGRTSLPTVLRLWRSQPQGRTRPSHGLACA